MSIYTCHRYVMMTIDPVHIGTGGYRLGRVDNSIMREPGTRLPKIPGTSLHGAARTYAARLCGDLAAAGATHNIENPEQHPICYTFGTITHSGVVSISDARLLLFPVASMHGPVWVTTRQLLDEAGFTLNGAEGEPAKEQVWYTGKVQDKLNLGWLMLPVEKPALVIEPPDTIKDEARWTAISDKIVVVHAALFAAIVNSNLEVRTSVSIDPKRGAAEDGALFTYEALPRATFLSFDVIVDDYRGKFDKTKKPEWDCPLTVVDAGLRLIEWLSIGGMGTRGFGRAAMLGHWDVANVAEANQS
ncbi:MAG: type III-B CRISPR module RAMP protein Cmr4 [Cyanobacteria bacterium M5B4]|nr:MAG: type III-B CRISPR module RAMP protein Cmr4 [Cyanobacteria bacterium M5B4]